MTDSPIRLDKWLWAARFFKTRALAKKAIEGGKVHYQGARGKPSKTVELGAELTVRQGWSELRVIITGLSEQRRGATEARLLYEETSDSITKRQLEIEQRKLQRAAMPQAQQRPTKKQRRQIVRFKSTHDSAQESQSS